MKYLMKKIGMKVALPILSVVLLSSVFQAIGVASPVSPPFGIESRASPPLGIAAAYPIDGRVDFSRLVVQEADVHMYSVLEASPSSKTTRLRWGMVNDDRNVYFAFQWTDDTFNNALDPSIEPADMDFDGIRLLFDTDGDGFGEWGEDARSLFAAGNYSVYLDQHLAGEVQDDTVGNGFGKLSYDSVERRYSAEFLFPIGDDSYGQDGKLNASTRFNVMLADHFQPAVPALNLGLLYPSIGDSSQWQTLATFTEGVVHAHPTVPENLTGMIVFVSTHEEANGAIYSFDPATRAVRRITYLPELFKDNVSLSHDRTRVAFHGAPRSDAYSDYEIYSIHLDGTQLKRLTYNNIPDGHPAWSNDDRHIAYASFRGAGGRSNIVVMGAEGNEVGNLSPIDASDNDPEYLPSGEIVFKTDRYGNGPETATAIMDSAGGNVRQLTFPSGFSDHDPVGSIDSVLVERFNKDTDYSTDPEAGFAAWDIVEINTTTMEERVLLADGWVNWLPVYDPTAEYIVYLKTVGYTGAFLMDKDGVELGQLISNITKIRYIDWK